MVLSHQHESTVAVSHCFLYLYYKYIFMFQGDGIFLIQKFSDLERVLAECDEYEDVVVQKYVDKPLLLDGFKFDFR